MSFTIYIRRIFHTKAAYKAHRFNTDWRQIKLIQVYRYRSDRGSCRVYFAGGLWFLYHVEHIREENQPAITTTCGVAPKEGFSFTSSTTLDGQHSKRKELEASFCASSDLWFPVSSSLPILYPLPQAPSVVFQSGPVIPQPAVGIDRTVKSLPEA